MKKISIGIVGAGLITDTYLSIIKKTKLFEVLAIASRTVSKAKNISKKYGIKNYYDSYLEMIDKNNLDGIFILVSADQIYKVTNEILDFKIPLFLEKPPGLSYKEASTLAKKAKKKKVLNMVCFNRRFYSNFEKGLNLISSKGKLLGVSIEGHERFWNLKKYKNKKILEAWIYANSIHTIDLLRFFGGEISRVFSVKNSLNQKNGDQFKALIEFKNKALGSYTSHWHSPGGWNVKLFGEGVTVIFDPLENGYSIDEKFNKKIIKNDKYDNIFKPGFYQQIKSFRRLIEKKKLRYPAQDLKSALKTMELIKKISS